MGSCNSCKECCSVDKHGLLKDDEGLAFLFRVDTHRKICKRLEKLRESYTREVNLLDSIEYLDEAIDRLGIMLDKDIYYSNYLNNGNVDLEENSELVKFYRNYCREIEDRLMEIAFIGLKIYRLTAKKELELDKLTELYRKKNADYGNSFTAVRYRYSNAIMIRLLDKFNRVYNLLYGGRKDIKVYTESIEDTLMDMINYSIMELVEFKLDTELDKLQEEKESLVEKFSVC